MMLGIKHITEEEQIIMLRTVRTASGLKTGRGAFLQTDPAEQGQHQQEPGHSLELLPTQASHTWVSLHNVFRGEPVECGSVKSLCRLPGVRSAAAPLLIFMQFLGILQQILKPNQQEKENLRRKSQNSPRFYLYSVPIV